MNGPSLNVSDCDLNHRIYHQIGLKISGGTDKRYFILILLILLLIVNNLCRGEIKQQLNIHLERVNNKSPFGLHLQAHIFTMCELQGQQRTLKLNLHLGVQLLKEIVLYFVRKKMSLGSSSVLHNMKLKVNISNTEAANTAKCQ